MREAKNRPMFTFETGSVRMTSHCLWVREWLWCLTPLSIIFQLYRGGQFDYIGTSLELNQCLSIKKHAVHNIHRLAWDPCERGAWANSQCAHGLRRYWFYML